MAYLHYEPVTIQKLTCSHPQVKRIWEYGGLANTETDDKMYRYISIILQDGTRREFKDNPEWLADVQLEKFLSELPE